MKYKVVKDKPGYYGCLICVNELGGNCDVFIKENNLPNCLDDSIHFEEDDTITDVDLKEIDEAL
jgi:hypothetical protein